MYFPLQYTCGTKIIEQLNDVLRQLRDGWCHGQMVSGCLVSVLISSPVDGDGLSIDDVRIATLGDGSGSFFGDLFLVSFLGYLGGIGELESKAIRGSVSSAIDQNRIMNVTGNWYPKE